MNKILLVIVLVLILGGGYYIMKGKSAYTPSPQPSEQPVTEVSGATGPSSMNASASESSSVVTDETGVKAFTLEGGMYYFKPNEIRVKKGDTLKVTLNSKEGTHNFVVDAFNLKSKLVDAGKSDTVSFVASKTGTFEFYCSVGQHRANGMVGKLIVE